MITIRSKAILEILSKWCMGILTPSRGTLPESRIFTGKGGDIMTSEATQHENNCVNNCDAEFIDCVEHSHSDCLDEFNSCAAVCKR